LVFAFALGASIMGAAGLVAGMLMHELPPPKSIATYHGDPRRSGQYVAPHLTWERAHGLRMDTSFHPVFSGHVHAQPLFWTIPGTSRSLVIVATEENVVYAFDAKSGRTVWSRVLGPPVQRGELQCGDIFPLGVTGTPVIDPVRQVLYLDAAVGRHDGPGQLIFALNLKDGTPLQGWPVDLEHVFSGQEPEFLGRRQNQRGALLIFGDMVYVPFGSFFDCDAYHGTVVGISLSDPQKVARWATRAKGGGVWAPGGVVSDEDGLFLATGNTFNATDWSDGEAIIRLSADLQPSVDEHNYFTPADWLHLDDEDSDLGSIAPIMVHATEGADTRRFVLALGKDGKAYLLDRDNLGGIGGAVAITTISARGIYSAAASYTIEGTPYVAFPASDANCPMADSRNGVTAIAVHGTKTPSLNVAWCAPMRGLGAPITTTIDGRAYPIVWMLGAEGDNRLHAFRADTGEVLFDGPDQGLKGLHRFQTLIATRDRLYVAADNAIYAFKF
jgi:outer membrane protein assembly factor BamB